MRRAIENLVFTSILAGTACLAACSGGSGGGSGDDPTLTFAITDTASDEIESFTVEVTHIELKKLGGAIVTVMDTPAAVDLATLTDTSQILNVGTVPVGTYLSAEITLDFTSSSCVLVGQATPATILDIEGNPLTGLVTLPIDFGTNRLIAPFNRHRLLEFDFDLNQSVTVDSLANEVTVEPAFAMHVDPAAPKTLLAVGTLVSVDSGASTFEAEVRTLGGTLLSTATLRSDASTIWHVDGVSHTGAPGLAALAAHHAGTWVQVAGTHDPLEPVFDVVYVEAGTGTYNGGTDIVQGHIVDRTGGAGGDPILTVLGHSTDAGHTTFQFNTTFQVTASFANTKVVRTAVDQDLDTDELSIGQRVRVFGTLVGTDMDATSASSVVRVQPTRVLGFAAGPDAGGVLTIDLSRVDLRPETDFNWPASGMTPPDPNAFTLQVGLLGAGQMIEAGDPIESRGFFPPVDDAAEDFVSSSLTNRSLAPSLMFLRNRPGGLDVSAVASPTAIQFDLSGLPLPGEFAIVDFGFVGTLDLPTSPSPSISPTSVGFRLYVLRDKGLNRTTLYLSFANFSAEVAHKIALGAEVVQVAAIGTYDDVTNRTETPLASVVVE